MNFSKVRPVKTPNRGKRDLGKEQEDFKGINI
jgi:hypothetical protein